MDISQSHQQAIVADLLSWYDQHARKLPWRYSHADEGNPYHTWLSEVMLQQTVVAAVTKYFNVFIQKWPTLADLAKANQDEVLVAWQGLGYYSRGRNLLKCAQVVQNDFNGMFPKTVNELRTLPGVGPYTSAAIASIAFRQPVVPVDGNVIRVFSRLFAITDPLPGLKDQIQQYADRFDPGARPGDFAQALMDLGATVCRPKAPSCDVCPLRPHCKAYKKSIQNTLPRRLKKTKKPTRYGRSLVVFDKKGYVLLEKRPESGLLAGMMQVPTTPWDEDLDVVDKYFRDLVGETKITQVDGVVTHTFTHFHLENQVFTAGIHDYVVQSHQVFVDPKNLGSYALPTVMKKILTFCGL